MVCVAHTSMLFRLLLLLLLLLLLPQWQLQLLAFACNVGVLEILWI